ncbi:MAG: prolyl-tRNA synthetase associated domain-containing protein [Bacteroidales bacterium]|nr:prolyl-tRNA synthetase associated domain-containing protein [Candidatus Minthousia equi]
MESQERIEKVLHFLDAHGLEYKMVQHPPLFTIEEGLAFWNSLQELQGCTHCKNLFLRNHSGKRHYLVTMECHKSLNFVQLQQIIREGKLTFASEERMERCLGLLPGSVSPLGLIHDIDLQDANPRELFENGHRVKFFIDKDLRDALMMTFHPCDNRACVALSHDTFLRFLQLWGGEVEWFDMQKEE